MVKGRYGLRIIWKPEKRAYVIVTKGMPAERSAS
jgi:hypothetical protein